MASLVSTIADVYYNLRKPLAATAFVVKAAATDSVATSPTISSGSGAPDDTANAEPEGSLYMRIDATDGDDALYYMIAASWVPLLGATA